MCVSAVMAEGSVDRVISRHFYIPCPFPCDDVPHNVHVSTDLPPHCPFQCDVILVANAAAIIITGITHWMASSNSSAKLPGQRVLLIRQPTSLAMLVRTPPPSSARQSSTFPDNICYYHPAQQQSSLISPSLSQHSNNHYQHQLFQRGFWNAIVEKY